MRVWGAEDNFFDFERTALEGIARPEAFWSSIGQKVRLSGLGIGGDRLVEMASKCTDDDTHKVGHFVPLTSKDIEAIYRLALLRLASFGRTKKRGCPDSGQPLFFLQTENCAG